MQDSVRSFSGLQFATGLLPASVEGLVRFEEDSDLLSFYNCVF
jgi:hypothetical protein